MSSNTRAYANTLLNLINRFTFGTFVKRVIRFKPSEVVGKFSVLDCGGGIEAGGVWKSLL